MNLRHISTRVAVAGTATAVLAGGLVAATGVAATADSGSAAYTCVTALSPNPIPVTVGVSADLTTLPPLPTGFPAPAGALPVEVSFTVSSAVVNGFIGNGITSVGMSSDDFKLPFGTAKVPLTGVAVEPATLVPDTETVLTAGAANGAFKLPDPGTDIPVKMPASFTASAATNLIALPLTCTLDGDSPTISQLTVIKQTPTLTAKAPKTVKVGKTLKVKATLAGNVAPTGKVVAKEGKKTVGTAKLKKGKATISIKGLKKGKHTILVSYGGDKRSNKSNVYGVTVKVKK